MRFWHGESRASLFDDPETPPGKQGRQNASRPNVQEVQIVDIEVREHARREESELVWVVVLDMAIR